MRRKKLLYKVVKILLKNIIQKMYKYFYNTNNIKHQCYKNYKN